MLRKLSVVLLSLAFASLLSAQAPKSRHFTFDYSFTVRVTAPGLPLEVWFPVAHSDQYQQVKIISKTSDLPLGETTEPEYGNRMFHARTAKAEKSEYRFSVKYDVVRLEHFATVANERPAKTPELKRFLQPDKLVPISGKPAEIAAQQVKPGMSEMEKTRAFYDYTFNTMRYEKTGVGWGRGDTLWACDSHHGNCTDFHSVFISMARSQHIPARFEIGFSIPEDKAASDIAGYHCWAEFYTASRGWVPVDISEAWRHQEKRNYFFGAHDANRIQFSIGRDVQLSPKQHGQPLNYFIYPYVELNGKEYPNVSIAFSFAEVNQASATRDRAVAARSAQ
jgi:transglutaminase-like putative cysteine protease